MSDAELSPVKRALVEIRRLRARLADVRPAKPCPVAIVGAAVRMPGGVTTLDAFWNLLDGDADAIGETPPSRWETGAIYSADPDAPGMTFATRGAFLDDVASFDAEFFAISPREAESMDPQHRLLLECAWEALENAAIAPSSLAGTNAGVVVAIGNTDYGRMLLADRGDIDAYSTFGGASALASGRIAYALDLHGPNAVVDTACSGSLAAVHLACNSLALHEAETMIVGAANLMLTPDGTISFTKARMLSPDGRCKTYDADADGYVRGEGCAVVVLKRLADAQAANDPILAVVRGSAINHDGKSAGMTAPNGPAQVRVVRAALADAGLAPDAVDYVETHGTGTPLGDPIELEALAQAYGTAHTHERPLAIGSVKTTLGHLEAAAGLAGLLKAALALERERIPAHRNVVTPTPLFAWDEHPLEIVRSPRAWPRGERPRAAGVSSFGFSGTNVHVILEEAPAPATRDRRADGRARLFCISARSENALRELARRFAAHAATSGEPLDAMCRTAHAGRATFTHRLAVRARDARDLAETLASWAEGGTHPNVAAGIAEPVPHGALVYPDDDVDGTGRDAALAAIGRAYVAGAAIDPDALDGDGPRCANLPTYPFQRRTFWRPRAHARAAWDDVVAAARAQSEFGPLGWDLTTHDARRRTFETLSATIVADAFARLGAFGSAGVPATADDVIAAHGILPRRRPVVARMLRLLAREGLLREADGTFVADRPLAPRDLAPLWSDAERFRDDDPDAFAYLERSAAVLAPLLAGDASPLDVLFADDHAAAGTYARGTAARYLNAIAAAALRAAIAGRVGNGTFRVLEAGAGTGGTTAALAPLLPDDAEYWFTDVSDAFVAKAKRTFTGRTMRFATLDIDGPIPDDIPHGAFDAVVAANVVHATRDAGETLDRLRALLAPGGVLIMIESTRYHAALDLTFAFLDGWDAYDDAYRSEHPLLGADRWTALLRERGFAFAERLPGAGSPADLAGQHVILARNGADAPSERRGGGPSLHDARRGAPPAAPLDLTTLPPEERRERVRSLVTRCVCRVLNLRADEAPGPRDRFTELGMDSLLALELKRTLASELGAADAVSATLAFDTGTIESLSDYLLTLLAPDAAPAIPAAAAAETFDADTIAAFSDDEVEALLLKRLERTP